MIYKFRIDGELPGINQYINAERSNRFKAAKMKGSYDKYVRRFIDDQLRHIRIYKPVRIMYVYYCSNRRRDKDNISGFAHKVIQDALVNSKVLVNDGWDNIEGFSDYFKIDKHDPHIEVSLIEMER